MPRLPLLFIALYFAFGGISHFANPQFFTAMMPDYLPYHAELVAITGVFELLGAVGILLARTRLAAGYCLMAFMLAVLPVHIHMSVNAQHFSDTPALILHFRIALQFVFIAFVWWAISPERKSENIIQKTVK